MKANLAFRLKMARQTAEAYLHDNGHTTLPVDPFAIAAKHQIEVKAKPDTVGGVSGMLLRHGDNFGILCATHTGSEGFERFSVGNELGHFGRSYRSRSAEGWNPHLARRLRSG
jgi:hypothetical protein